MQALNTLADTLSVYASGMYMISIVELILYCTVWICAFDHTKGFTMAYGRFLCLDRRSD